MDALTVKKLAEELQESNVSLLQHVLRVLGADRTTAVLADTLTLEANGGMPTRDGTRRRTPGGVFFQLVKERVTARERWQLFAPPASQTPRAAPQVRPQALTWDEVATIGQTLAATPAGEATTMKLTVIGRPGNIEMRGQAVLFRMQGKPPASVPRGLPPLPTTPGITWHVMVALRQWNRVKDSLASNQDDQIIVEGYPLLQGTQHVLLVQRCTSVALQRAQKQAQPPQAEMTP